MTKAKKPDKVGGSSRHSMLTAERTREDGGRMMVLQGCWKGKEHYFALNGQSLGLLLATALSWSNSLRQFLEKIYLWNLKFLLASLALNAKFWQGAVLCSQVLARVCPARYSKCVFCATC